ncbi:MAG: hypothetical protein C0425_01865 [Chlorobiaceae bacterium]|nr:hypothetical protein [Chlorobiaceae bacterium]MBA4309064.1 hypothetical protein [Chlorobiaceae bacterium]
MRLIYTLVLAVLLFLPTNIFPQFVSDWDKVPEWMSERNSFKRLEWFYRQRAFPYDTISISKFRMERTKEIEHTHLRKNTLTNPWQQLGPSGVISTFPTIWGVNSGRVRGLAVHPNNENIVYAGPAAGGVWKTTNGGQTWRDMSADLNSLTFGQIAIDPNNPEIIYAGTGEIASGFNNTLYNGDGLYKSINGGVNWTRITNGFGDRTHFGAIVVNPANSNIILAALGSSYWLLGHRTNEGIWRSTDAGLTWSHILNAPGGFDIVAHPTIPNRFYAALGEVNSNAGFYVSTNAGATWTQSNNGLPTPTTISRMQISVAQSQPSTIYAVIFMNTGSPRTRVYKSVNDGVDWLQISSGVQLGGNYGSGWADQGWYDLCIIVSPTDPNRVFVGNVEIHRTTNGSTFSPLRNSAGPYGGTTAWDSPMHVDYHEFAFAPSNPNVLYVGNDGGVFKSVDGGNTFSHANNGLNTLQLYRVASHPTNQNILIGGAQDNGVFATLDGGATNWVLESTGDGMELFYDRANPNTIFITTQNGSIQRSTNAGLNWSGISVGTDSYAWTSPFWQHTTNSATIYIAGRRLWRSTNSGTNWTAVTTNITASSITSVSQSSVNPNNMILVASEFSNSPQLFVSTDEGLTWTVRTIPGTQRYSPRVLMHPTQANTCYLVKSGFGTGKLFRSTDIGVTWTDLSGDLPDVPASDVFVDPLNIESIYLANDLGVYQSSNDGVSWARLSNGMPVVPVLDFSYFQSGTTRLLRAATHGRGVYQVNLLPPQTGITLSGNVTYNNSSNTPLSNVNINLTPGTFSGVTNSSGNYSISSITNNNYNFIPTTNRAWGGVTGSDVTTLRMHIIGTSTISNFRLAAADVNNDANITGSDVTAMRQRIVGMINSFPAGDWKFNNQNTLTVSGSNINLNFQGLTVGDVNGDFVPTVAKTIPKVNINYAATLRVNKGAEFEVPIKINSDLEISSYTFHINYQTEYLKFKGVKGFDGIFFNEQNGLISLVWDDVKLHHLKANQTIFSLQFEPTENFRIGDFLSLDIDEEKSELGSLSKSLSNIGITVPSIEGFESTKFNLVQNYPNPFNPATKIKYYLQAESNVKLTISDPLGRVIVVLVNETKASGEQEYIWNAEKVATGVYFYTLEVTELYGGKNYRTTKKMLYTK